MAWLKNYWHSNLSLRSTSTREKYKYMGSSTKALRRISFASVSLKSTKSSKVCIDGKNYRKDKRLVAWFLNYQHSNVGIHNTGRCVVHLAPNRTPGQGTSGFVYLFGQITKYKQNISFSDSLPLG